MKTKLIQFALLVGTLLMTILIWVVALHYHDIIFNAPKLSFLISAAAIYLYGATTFLAMKGINLLPKSK